MCRILQTRISVPSQVLSSRARVPSPPPQPRFVVPSYRGCTQHRWSQPEFHLHCSRLDETFALPLSSIVTTGKM